MSKKLNESAMQSELSGSAFFQPRIEPQEIKSSPLPTNVVLKPKKEPKSTVKSTSDNLPTIEKKSSEKQEDKDKNDTMIPRHHDTTVSSNQDEMIETIRKAVKSLGKEAATYRFTQEEKKALADIVYTYKMSGIKTSENEVTRTAINFLVEDYRENGSNSILARVLERLNG